MSVLGTGVIAGVAQTALQAQQVARQRRKPLDDRERARQRVNEVLELRLHGLGEDGDAAPSSTALHVDATLPERPRQDPLDRPVEAVQRHPGACAQVEQRKPSAQGLAPPAAAPLGPPAAALHPPISDAASEPDAAAAAAYRNPQASAPHRLDVEA